ncbi:PspC domain-containing protein [Spiractinospora alimapuensis]|uniref:PspC domain-containing protein n=1 Tax=Spiractinospora alimapuensis TaxID=2820884 RepID=UPI001F310F1F|nr:PspC domain-containing protein [Spiractinospora alimapuensis]QVQ54454.1 PspC domain-containing protein [Spiractinospora alimapuensis]
MSDKKLRRSVNNRLLTGVCGGIGEYFNVDANIIRLAFAVFTLFGGSGILLYIIAWLVIPESGAPSSVLENIIGSFTKKN